MTFIRTIDINTQRNRAVFLIVEGKDMFFGLAIRREKNNHIDRWAFYVGITEEEYNFFVRDVNQFDGFSFVGLPSVAISIPQTITEVFGLQPPTRYIGVHFDFDETGHSWSDSSITFHLERFFHWVRKQVIHETQT